MPWANGLQDFSQQILAPHEKQSLVLSNGDACVGKADEEVLPPDELLKDYFAKRTELDRKIDRTLADIQRILGIDIS